MTKPDSIVDKPPPPPIMNNPTISIITIAKNNLAGLKLTAKSIEAHVDAQNSSTQLIEWVVVDGASKDGSYNYLQSLRSKWKFVWRSEPDLGIFDAMNKGLQLASGDYVYFLNSGDTLYSATCITEAVQMFSKNDDIVCGQVSVLDCNGNPLGLVKLDPWIPHQGAFVKRDLLFDYGFDPKLKVFGDLDLWYRLRADGKFHPKMIDLIVAEIKLDGVGSHPKFIWRRLRDKFRFNLKHKRFVRAVSDCLFLVAAWLVYKSFGYSACLEFQRLAKVVINRTKASGRLLFGF